MLQRSKYIFVLFSLGLLLFSCDKNRVFDQYISTADGWDKKKAVVFNHEQQDTVSLYNMYVNVRTTDAYPYSNLFLIVETGFPDKTVKRDTLEYQMTNPDGSMMGKGFSDVKESALWFKYNYTFPQAGKYTFKVFQAVREVGHTEGISKLDGITEVGFRIENTNTNE